MSRLLAGTIALTQFQVTGEIPGADDIFSIISAALSRFAFQPIDNNTEPASLGWVQADDTAVATFDNPGSLWIDHLLLFSLRQDVRRIPTAVLNAEIKKESEAYLQENPNLRRVPKHKRAELKELVTLRLLAKTLPVPTVCDVVWDTKAGVISLFANANKMIDLFDRSFRKTFPEFTLQMIVPYRRAEQEASFLNLSDALSPLNQSATDNVVSLIRDNVWIGQDFLLWLLAGGSDGITPGFSAWIDNRLVMIGATGEGTQKIAVTGDVHDRLPTIKTALLDGKHITSATIFIENSEENNYRLTLAGDTFIINGFKTPTVRLTGEVDDAVTEFQASVLEKMFLINTGMGYLQTLLRLFLEARLTDRWSECRANIQAWMDGEV
jgi:hypothetical protein